MSDFLPEDRIEEKALITGTPKVNKEYELDCPEHSGVDYEHASRITMKDVNKMIDLTVQSGYRSKTKFENQHVCCTEALKLKSSKTEDVTEDPNHFPTEKGPSNIIPELMKEKETWRAGLQRDGSYSVGNDRLMLKGAADILFVPNKITSTTNGGGHSGYIGQSVKAKRYQ